MTKSTYIFSLVLLSGIAFTGCKKKGCTDPAASNYNSEAEKKDNSCEYNNAAPYVVPTNYLFEDENGNSTVSYSGQTDRLNQLEEMVVLMKSGTGEVISAQDLKDMFANTNDNGNGNFSFSSTKQLKDKTFAADVTLFETWMDDLAVASVDFSTPASSGQAGTLTSGSSTYLFDANGQEKVQLIEKGLMGATFMYQALNVYFGDAKMDVDNTTAVDPGAGKYYTTMEHHWDEAFGYFDAPIDFLTNTSTLRFWAKYCDAQDANLNSNSDMMVNFLKGRAAISNNVLADRDAAIATIRTEWEEISAHQAISYLDDALGYFGNDNAKFLHVISEAYAFSWNLRYSPVETRRMTIAEHQQLMALFPANFWDISIADINAIKTALHAKY